MNWSDLLGAFALYLVLEGILPFVSPQAMKRVTLAFTDLRITTYTLACAPGVSPACLPA